MEVLSLIMYPLVNTTTYNAFHYNKPMTRTAWQRLVEAHEDVGRPRTQTAIAKTCGTTQPAAQRWAAGDGLPSLKHVITFCMETGVCVEWIFTARGPKHPEAKPGSVTEAVLQIFHALDEDGQEEVLRHARYIADRNAGRPAH